MSDRAEEPADERYCLALHALYGQYGDKSITQPTWHDTLFTWTYIRNQYFVVRQLEGILRWEYNLIDAGYKPPGTLPSLGASKLLPPAPFSGPAIPRTRDTAWPAPV